MTELVTTNHGSDDMGAFDPTDTALLRYLNLNPDDPKSRAAVAVCRRYNLDAVLKHVVVIPGGGVFITRDGLLHIAHRSGQLDGIVVEQDPTLDGDEWKCKVSVYRKDMRFPFTFPGRYPANGGNKKYAQEMALKVAESHAYRRAFDINGLPTLDEHEAGEARPTATAPAVSVASFGPGQIRTPGPDEPVLTNDVQDAEVVDEGTGEVDTISDGQRRAMFAAFTDAGFTTDARSAEGRAARLEYISRIVGRPIESSNDLTRGEAGQVIDALAQDASEGGE